MFFKFNDTSPKPKLDISECPSVSYTSPEGWVWEDAAGHFGARARRRGAEEERWRIRRRRTYENQKFMPTFNI